MADYRTARGKIVDIEALRLRNEDVLTVGNTGRNARGDLVDEKGKVIQSKAQTMSDHYRPNRTSKPVESPIVEGTQAAKRQQRAAADELDNAKLLQTIELLTKQLAERDAASTGIVKPVIEPSEADLMLEDEISTIIGSTSDPVDNTRMRGGLAAAISKSKNTGE